MVACVPAIRPLYMILFHRPGAENYRRSSRQKRAYQRQISPHDKPRKIRSPDTELMSLGTGWNGTTLRGTGGDGEGLVDQGNKTIRQTVEVNVRFDSKRNSTDVEEGRQSRGAQDGW